MPTETPNAIRAGAAALKITPRKPMFLWGYPNVERTSEGVHDDLFASALYIQQGNHAVLFIANDIIFVPKAVTAAVRERLSKSIGIAPERILLSSTHTHSGPMTVSYASNQNDPVVPPLDPEYMEHFEDQMVLAGLQAHQNAREARIGFSRVEVTETGSNRHDPSAPRDAAVPIIHAREKESGALIGCMIVHAMHPTVLHEDFLQVSGDFPGLARRAFQEKMGPGVPFLVHSGASGNLSPRHVTKGNTIEEADRLGRALAAKVLDGIENAHYHVDLGLEVATTSVDLDIRTFPEPEEARRQLEKAKTRFESLKAEGAPRAQVRTAECDLFGAEEIVTLSGFQASNELGKYRAACLPAEIQLIHIGPWYIAAWPGEFFVEYALELRAKVPGLFLITMANGELQGYIVTEEGAKQGGYEASNALFDARNGRRFVDETLKLVEGMQG